LLRAAYERSIFLGSGLRDAPGDGSAVVEALKRLRELLLSEAGGSLDAALYWTMLCGLHRDNASPLIRGAVAGLLYAAGQLSEADLATALDGHINGMSQPREAVGFLRGLLHTAREAAWQQESLLRVLDRLLQHWDEPGFVAVLPELRLAFAGMTPKETDRIAEAVAQLHGASQFGPLVRYDLSEAEVQRHLALSASVRELLTADGLDAWVGA